MSPLLQQNIGAAAADFELGPRLRVFLHDCLVEKAPLFGFVLLTSALATVFTCGIIWRHRQEILRAPLTLQRLYYLRVLWFAPTFGVSAFVALLCPRAFELCSVAQSVVESITITMFGTILFMLLAEESNNLCKGTDWEGEGIGTKIIHALAAQGPKKHFAVPPIGCLFARWVTPHDLKPQHLVLARNLFQQYAFVIAVTSIFTDLLHQWNIKTKIIAVKLVVFLSNFQNPILGIVLLHVHGPLTSEGLNLACFAGHGTQFWTMYVLSIESVCLALLVRRGFSAAELTGLEAEHHVHVVELELLRLSETQSKAVAEVGASPKPDLELEDRETDLESGSSHSDEIDAVHTDSSSEQGPGGEDAL